MVLSSSPSQNILNETGPYLQSKAAPEEHLILLTVPHHLLPSNTTNSN